MGKSLPNIINRESSGDYDWAKIGKRIESNRKSYGFSQDELAVKLFKSESSRKSIGKWEKATARPSLDDMLRLCGIFDCELGYLLGEHDCKTREATDIRGATGLSENAIKSLKVVNKYAKDDGCFYTASFSAYLEVLSFLIEQVDTIRAEDDIISLISHYFYAYFTTDRIDLDDINQSKVVEVTHALTNTPAAVPVKFLEDGILAHLQHQLMDSKTLYRQAMED